MSAAWVILVVLVLLLLVGNPYTGWQHYGSYASGIVGLGAVVVMLLLLWSVF